MLGGVFLAFAVTLRQPQEFSRQFFDGMGAAYANVIGIIAAVAVFTTGMELIGVSGAFIEALNHSPQLAKLTATFGPFTIAVISGSGDAATLAFNGTVAPYARQLGLEVSQVGSQAFLAGALGRSMSPLAGAAIVCAALAGVNPAEVAKRNAPGMIIAAAVTMLFLI
jgi:DcuC family C4-dicarboxylate transporter